MSKEHDVSTVEGRKALKELCERASPEPWVGTPDEIHSGADHVICFGHDYDEYGGMETSDIDFIAAARTALPAALAQIEALTQERDEMQQLFDLEYSRVQEATKRWQAKTGNKKTWPDLGKLLTWQFEQIEADKERIEALERERDNWEQAAKNMAERRKADLLALEKELEEARKLVPKAKALIGAVEGLEGTPVQYNVAVPLAKANVAFKAQLAAFEQGAALNEPAPPSPQPEPNMPKIIDPEDGTRYPAQLPPAPKGEQG